VVLDLPQVPLPGQSSVLEAREDVAAAVPIPTAMPTPTPIRVLPVALQIPSIQLDSPVVESKLVVREDMSDHIYWSWEVPSHAVGFQVDSDPPGAGGNVVLSGHNNTQGRVFRRLTSVKEDDVVIVKTAVRSHQYRVTEKRIIPYRRDPAAAEQLIYEYMKDFGTERLTILSCYPYPLNYDRIIVVAEPVQSGVSHDTRN
jgi:sortase A